MNVLPATFIVVSVVITFQVIFVGGENAGMGIAGGEDPVEEFAVLLDAGSRRPAPAYLPSLTPYLINKDHDIWHAQVPSSYITPENAWVKYYASLLYLDDHGRLRYKDRPVPFVVDAKGNVLSWTDEPFLNHYVSDNEQFNYPPNSDVWVMPDYYLARGMKDDCDGWMVAVASMMLSGELSVLENGAFVKQTVPAKAVLGYMGGYRDGWVEYRVYGKTFLTTTALVKTGIDGTEKRSVTEFVERAEKGTARPVFEFTHERFGAYMGW